MTQLRKVQALYKDEMSAEEIALAERLLNKYPELIEHKDGSTELIEQALSPKNVVKQVKARHFLWECDLVKDMDNFRGKDRRPVKNLDLEEDLENMFMNDPEKEEIKKRLHKYYDRVLKEIKWRARLNDDYVKAQDDYVYITGWISQLDADQQMQIFKMYLAIKWTLRAAYEKVIEQN